MAIHRLNHAVLYVRDVARSVAFYRDVLDFEVIMELGGQAAFLRAAGSSRPPCWTMRRCRAGRTCVRSTWPARSRATEPPPPVASGSAASLSADRPLPATPLHTQLASRTQGVPRRHTGYRLLGGPAMLGLIITLIIVVLIARALARLLVPGRDPMGLGPTILIGIVGSFIGGFLGYVLFHKDGSQGFFQPSGLIGSVIG